MRLEPTFKKMKNGAMIKRGLDSEYKDWVTMGSKIDKL
jgi:hypothetical protein